LNPERNSPDSPPMAVPRHGLPRREAIERALNYPYHWLDDCYQYHGGQAHPVQEREALRHRRIPVLAYGSNRSLQQLRRKFGDIAPDSAILVERCDVDGWDVVHSAHITSYGAIPAALHQCRDVTIEVAVTWLTREQVRIMDASERAGRNYGRSPIGCRVRLAQGDVCDAVQAYLTSHGPLTVCGQIVSHAAVAARGRSGIALRNDELLERAHRAFQCDLSFDEFVMRLVVDGSYRERVTDRLKQGL
jgi:hypothetical protein